MPGTTRELTNTSDFPRTSAITGTEVVPAVLPNGSPVAIPTALLVQDGGVAAGHIGDQANPHGVTKAQVGLGNADNTSDADKPVSTAQAAADNALAANIGKIFGSRQAAVDATQAAIPAAYSRIITMEGGALVFRRPGENTDDPLFGTSPFWGVVSRYDAAAVQSGLTAHLNDTANPHGVTKAQVGLGNVDNTSDADKPVSTAQQAALDTLSDAAMQNRGNYNTGSFNDITQPGSHFTSFQLADGPEGFAESGFLTVEPFGIRILQRLQNITNTGPVYQRTIRPDISEYPSWTDVTDISDKPINNAVQSAIDALELSVDDVRDDSHRDAAPEYPWSVSDADGKMALGVDAEGLVRMEDYVPFGAPDRSGRKYLWSVSDADGRVALGVTKDGTVYSGVSESLGPLDPSAFSASIPVAHVREYPEYYGAIRIDAASYSVRRNKSGSEALIESQKPLRILPFWGQSNAGYSGDMGGPTITDPLFPQIAVSFAGGWSVHGSSTANEATLAAGDLAPIVDTIFNNALVTLSAYAVEATSRARSLKPSDGVFAFSSWYGGQPIDEFVEGSTLYENLRKACRAAKSIAADYGREVEVPAIVWVQGETPGVLDYQTTLEAIASAIKSDIQSDLSLASAPEFLVMQTNDGDASGALVPAIELAQLEATGVTVAGPMYQQPFADDIHGSAIGRMVLADSLSDVLRILSDTGSFTALRPLSATRTGTQVDVVFSVPGHGLALDDDWVKAATNYGFVWNDDSDSATITSVEIIGTDTVRLTLDQVPTGTNQTVEYALWQDSTDDGWASGRGQLYSPTRTPSVYWNLGYEVPQFARHYAVRFRQGVV